MNGPLECSTKIWKSLWYTYRQSRSWQFTLHGLAHFSVPVCFRATANGI